MTVEIQAAEPLPGSVSGGLPGDAVAVVGVGLCLPGRIRTLDGLWAALEGERDLVGEVPADRFDTGAFVTAGAGRAGKSYTAAGGFLDDVASFDAGYFGIAPKEATRIDPQQRLLLECAVEAFDDAAIDPASLAGSDTAVVIGVSSHDYSDLQARRLRSYNPYTMGGSAACNTANRLSYVFDFQGPSNAVDTACSSALTAVHQACEALRTGRSPLAIAGGVNVLLSPAGFAGFSGASMLSPTGRCRPFSASADGYVRSEGAGVLLLKPLSAALADGDRMHALILASGINADGRTAGLALPSARSQAALLERVYASAGVRPSDVAYVEAHGTGTQAGDPVECEALGRALGAGRTGGPLLVGSVKSNIGHMESAAGVAGLLKGLLVLREGRIPPTLHGVPQNPAIDFAALGLEPVVEARPLPETGKRVVGVNSFGFGGANAHVVLAAPPAPAQASGQKTVGQGARLPVVVSARTSRALTDAAQDWAAHFEGQAQQHAEGAGRRFYDDAFTASRRRAGREQRIAVLADGALDAAAALRSAASGRPAAAVAVEEAVACGRVAFVFNGNGAQWVGMGAELLSGDAAFAAEVAAVDRELAPLLGWSVRAELAAPSDPRRWERTEVTQPLLFAVQVGVVAALAARGIEPVAAMGHSVGEVAAAYCAGALSRSQACRVVAERSRAQAATVGAGRMAAAGLGAEAARRLLADNGYAERLVVAAVNSDQDVTIAGEAEALEALGAQLDAEGVFFRDLGLDYAFHTPAMDGIQEPLAEALAGLRPDKCRIPLISTVTGRSVQGTELDAAYWWRNVREPVLFAEAAGVLVDEELQCDVLVEVGPHPVLSGYLRRVAADSAHSVAVVATLSRVQPGPTALDAALTRLLAVGAQVDWKVFFPQRGAVTALPAYPWQRERHWNGHPDWWLEESGQQPSTPVRQPLLGARQPVAHPAWRQQINPDALAWMADHTVQGAVVWPAAAYTDMALAAGLEVFDAPAEIMGLTFDRALTLPFDDPDMDVALSASLDSDGAFAVSSRSGGQQDWSEHASGRVRRLLRDQPPALAFGDIRSRLTGLLSPQEHYAACARAGLPYGPAFRPLTALHTGAQEILAEYAATMEAAPGHQAHPTVLDGALQAGMPLLAAVNDDSCPYLPSGIETVRCWHPMPEKGLVHVRARLVTPQEAVWDITVSDADGTVALELLGCRLRRFEAGGRTRPQQLTEVLRAAPLAGETARPAPLPAPADVFAACAQEMATLTATWTASPYDRFRTKVMEMTGHFAGAAVRELLPGAQAVTVEALIAAGADVKYTQLLRTLLGTATEHGVLRSEGPGRWRLAKEPTPEPLFAALFGDFPGEAATALAYGACGQHLARVLRGQSDPLELLFSDADSMANRFYDGAPILAYHGRLAATLMASTIARWPQDRPLRILEVGAGTGATTAAMLPHLPRERAHYTFTDISSAFFPQAKNRFAAYDFVDYRVLDLESDPVEQGFALSSFDLVVASNVLHATTDLAATLRRVADLLADGGHLLAVESHSHEALAPVFGLLDTFWSATDRELRPDGPLLAHDRWKDFLHECGFTGTAQTGETASFALSDHSVLLTARRPRSHAPAAAPRTEAVPGRRWLVGSLPGKRQDPGPAQSSVVAALHDRAPSAAVRTTSVDDTTASWKGLLCAEQPPTDLVLFTEEVTAASPAEATDAAVRHLAVFRALSAACKQRTDTRDLTVWLIATSSQTAVSAPPAAEHGGAWGGARTLANEHPELTVRRIALTGARGEGQHKELADRVVRELLARPEEDEVLLTPAGRFATVVRPLSPPVTGSASSSYTLTMDDPGLHYRLAWRPAEVPTPHAGEIVIAVAAAALNYRDIMIATGRVPAIASSRMPHTADVGLECAGVVSAVGPGVTHVAVGDRVAGLARGCFGAYALARADRVMPLPAEMCFAAASTLPVAFATVHHSLNHLARLAPGETLLVHGAAGGVGLAALQYARRTGARVIATAGTPAKRDLLRLLGVEHVLDSRRLDFAEQVKDLTGGAGVDVVLNSLAGEALVRSVGLLKPHGRFLELGKRDFLQDSSLPLAPFLHNLTFFGVDLSPMMSGPSPLMDQHLSTLTKAVHAGDYTALPYRGYPAHRIDEAFTNLQHSRHTGKIVVTFDGDVPVRRPADRPVLDPDATYLITGGLSGFGAATARHLAARGARHLTLLSRRGENAPEAAQLLTHLRSCGTHAAVHAADISDEAALRRVLDDVDTSGRRLAGIIHAAMVLDDAPLAELSDDRLRAVLAPKMTGGLLLDALTRERSPDFFVVYSSAAALAGNIGQAAYVAGNLVLEGLVRARRNAGLPALAVQWGAITDTGYVHRTGRSEEMTAIGLGHLTAADALIRLDELLSHPEAATAAVGFFDWDRLQQHVMPTLTAPRTASLLQGRRDIDTADQWRDTLAATSPAETVRLVEDKLAELLAVVLQTTPERIDRSRRLDLLGVDSLMAVELASAISKSIGCDLPVVELTGAGHLSDLALRVLARLGNRTHTSN
ncbi:SDR family NAD(P)-dependent oxidoreductase [Streptomyces sp. Qhu-G9]|uniref:type I polyketide synthase n=1 Tax=Streptomyces sp. Qhu-G9 TaxID=3452799 RepID=UPI0022ABCDF7|nr:type I polyketide synthase [Streptomyces aurantiacus]WAU82460.1 SDR family NAD(P)-dependent oxidoreductase [Streptomyces aurantiacus]